MESYRNLWKPRHSTERNEPHNRKFDRSKVTLTPGFIKTMDRIQTYEKQEVSPLRPNLNLDAIFEFFWSKNNLFSHSWIKKTVIVVTFNIALDPAFCFAAVPRARWAWVPRRGDADRCLELGGGRKEKLVNKYHCPQKHTCEHPPTVSMAPPQPSTVFPFFRRFWP